MDPFEKQTRLWLEQAVIGLNLCPFAKHPHRTGRIRYVTEPSKDIDVLGEKILAEARWLIEQPEEKVSTTLIIHPNALLNFLEYNDFLSEVEWLIQSEQLEGKVQVASFHPDYQFAGTMPEDLENYTNRSPYPMIHLLREEQMERLLENYPEPEKIPDANIQTMNELGVEAIQELWKKIMMR